MKYTIKYFKDGMPEWKRKKDPILCRFIIRPISFFVASVCANLKICANIVSIFSSFIGVLACVFIAVSNNILNYIGCGLILFWLLLDCVDGNLARSVKKQPFGEFVDAMSSYILVGLLGVSLGIYCYKNGGLFFEKGSYIPIVLGALASSSDSLMRLIYQKYKATYYELKERNIISEERDIRTEQKSVSSLRVRFELEFGIAGIIPIMIIICMITSSVDIVVIYMLLYYGCSFIITTISYVNKTLKYLNIIIK